MIAVGDGANDLLMLQRSAFGVAFNGKPKLQENVSYYNRFSNVIGHSKNKPSESQLIVILSWTYGGRAITIRYHTESINIINWVTKNIHIHSIPSYAF